MSEMWDYLDKERLAEADPSWFDDDVSDAWAEVDLQLHGEEWAKYRLVEWLTDEAVHIGCQAPFNWQCRQWLNWEWHQ